MRLIRLTDSDLKSNGIPFKKNTLYAWHSKGKYKTMFVKIGGSVFLDVDEFFRIAAKQQEKKRKRKTFY